MAETMWSEGDAPPKKSGIPTWAWFCGAGCLLALIVAIVATVFIVDTVKKAIDPDEQWASLAEVLPFDERPAGWKPVFLMDMSLFGFEMFTLTGPGGEVALLMQLPEDESDETRKQMFDEKFTGSVLGLGGRSGTQPGTIEVQGRHLRAMRFFQKGGLQIEQDERPDSSSADLDPSAADSGSGSANPDSEEAHPPSENDSSKDLVRVGPAKEGASMLLDLTQPGKTRPLVLQLIRTGSSESFTDKEVQDFLKPFHVGPVR